MIPEIAKLVLEQRLPNAREVSPSSCPACGSDVKRAEGVARCVGGLFCAAQRKEAGGHFASRLALNIAGRPDRPMSLTAAITPCRKRRRAHWSGEDPTRCVARKA